MFLTFYDQFAPGPIVPVCKIGQNLGVYSQAAYRFYRVLHIEAVPAGPQMVQDLGAVNANTTAASSTQITVTDVQEGSLGQFRCTPLDDFEAQFSTMRGTGRWTTFTQQARLTIGDAAYDPYYALSTMFVLGNTRSIYVTPTNNGSVNLGQTRLKFWGLKYILDRMTPTQEKVLQYAVLNRVSELSGDEQGLLRGLSATVVSAEGRDA